MSKIIPWHLTGTANQRRIVREAFDRIQFPFERLRLPGVPELGWRDLNSRQYGEALQSREQGRFHGEHHHPPANPPEGSPAPELEEKPEPLFGGVGGIGDDGEERRWVMGVFYPFSARIYIDVRCESRPELAHSVVSAEIAHAVDEYLPLTEAQRHQIMLELHEGHVDHHTWWERFDYSSEYYSLIGETFMILFTKAYSDIPFGSVSSFVHTGHNMSDERIRQIIGIERTDIVVQPATEPPPVVTPEPVAQPAPVSPDTPSQEPPPTPEPEPETTPAPEPVPDLSKLKHFVGGKDIYHRLGHYGLSRGVPLTTLEGFTPCKICKPQISWRVPS